MRIVLHIGTPKTGSTAIQQFLFDHRRSLQRFGVMYPKTALVHNDAFGPRHKRLTHKGARKAEYWQQLLAELVQHDGIAILSCEAFWRYPEHIDEIAEYLSGHEVRVVAVLRRQDRFLASNYLHNITYARYGGTPSDWWRREAESCDYLTRLNQWSTRFQVIAIRYPERSRTLLRNVLSAAEVPAGALRLVKRVAVRYSNINETIGLRGARLLQEYDRLGLPKEKRDLLVELLRGIEPHWQHAAEVLGSELSASILDASREHNIGLFARYFERAYEDDSAWDQA